MADRHRDVLRHRQIQIDPRRASQQTVHPRRHLLHPEEPKRRTRRESARRRALAQCRRPAEPPRARCPVQVSRQHRAEAAARGDDDRTFRQRRLRAGHVHQRQTQQQLAERQLGLDAVRDRFADAVQDHVARAFGGRGHVVTEGSARVAELDQMFPGAREGLPAGESGRLRHGIAEPRRNHRHQDDGLAGTGAAPRHHDPQPRLKVVEALLGRQRSQEGDQSIDGGESNGELLAAHHPAGVGRQPGKIEADLAQHHPLQHPASLSHPDQRGAPPRPGLPFRS